MLLLIYLMGLGGILFLIHFYKDLSLKIQGIPK